MPARSFRLLLVAPLLWLSPFAPNRSSAADEPIRLRVLSYNINHGEGPDARTDLSRITAVIRAAEPDVVALQEVDRGMARTGRIDQARLLAGRLMMEQVFAGNFEFLGGEYGNAILSRFPIVEHQNHRLPSPAGGEPRGALEATLSLAENGPTLRIISTQFDHRREDENRIAAADHLGSLAEGDPVLLAGDFNAGPGSPTLDRLASRWSPTSSRPLPTVPADAPRAAFDHILAAPSDRWRVVEVRVIDDAEASDHRPILAVLEWLPAPSESPPNP